MYAVAVWNIARRQRSGMVLRLAPKYLKQALPGATGRTLRVLTIVDTFSRFSPALEPRFSFRGTDVVEVLERVGREVGLPATIRVEQGTEFVSRDLDLWAYQRGAIGQKTPIMLLNHVGAASPPP